MPGIERSNRTKEQQEIGGLKEIPIVLARGIFAVVHQPRQQPGLPGWIMCSPFGSERTNSQRLYVAWARFLAAAGHWVMRFDYRGTGDSTGRFEDHTIDDYLDDISSVTTELERISGMPCRGVFGLRLGADLAARFTAGFERPLNLVMWEPLIDGKKYRNSLLRTAVANELVNSNGPPRTRADFRRELAAGNNVSVDGFPLTPETYDAIAEISLPPLGRPTTRPIFIAQISTRRNQPLKPAIASLVDTYSEGGSVRLESVSEPPVWMKTKFYRWHLDELFEKTHSWMSEQSSEALPPLTSPPGGMGESADDEVRARPIGFEVEGEKVWGILHEPAQPRDSAPTIVLVSAGEACRTAFFYPQLARELAQSGWRVLCFDPRGIGDSEGDLECEFLSEVFFKIESGALVADVVAAMDFLETEYGSQGHVLVGLCGGAITSIFTAQEDDRVLGIAPFDFSLKTTPPPTVQGQSKLTPQIPWHEAFAQHRGTLFLLTARRIYHSAKNHCGRIFRTVSSAIPRRSTPVVGSQHWLRSQIGEDANLPLLTAVKELFDREIPMCFVFADKEHVHLFKTVLPKVCAERQRAESLINLRTISGADHNFIMPGCAEKLTGELVEWLDRQYGPLPPVE